MQQGKLIIQLFLTACVVGSLALSLNVLDPTLTPRCIGVSFFVPLITWLFFRSKEKLNIEWTIINSSFVAFAVYAFASYFWANTHSEVFFESSKLALSLATFSLSYFALTKNYELFVRNFLRFSILIVYAGLAMAIYQSRAISIFKKEDLYFITALNGHKNLYASFLFLNLFFLIQAVMTFKGLSRVVGFLAIVITLGVLVIIRTKAVWLGLAINVLVFAFVYLTKKIKLKPNFLVLLISALVVVNVFFAVVLPISIDKGLSHNKAITNSSSPEEKSKELDNERLVLWHKTYDMIGKHPLLGVGLGNWQIYFPDATLSGIWRAEDLNVTFQRPHNDWLWILSETGWLGFNLYLVFLLSILIYLWQSMHSEKADTKTQINISLCLAFILGYCTISFFDFPKERMEHLLWSHVLLGWSYFYSKQYGSLPTLKITELNSVLKLSGVAIAAVVFTVSVLRYRGEFYTIKLFNERVAKQELNAIRRGYDAISFAYSIDPTSVPIYWYTANSYALLKNYSKAQEEFLLAYQLAPYNRNVLSDLGSAYAYTNNTSLAKTYFEEALRISPRFDDPKLNLAAIYIKEQNWAKADTCLSTMFKDSERRTQYTQIVNAFLNKKAAN